MAKLMYITVEMHCSNEWVENVPTHARLAFDTKTMAFIRNARKAIKKLEAYQISRWDNVQTFLYDKEGDGNLVEIDENADDSFRTECENLVVTEHDVCWEGYVKHVDNSSWSTDHVSFEELDECWKVFNTKRDDLPLLINTLEHDTAKAALKERMSPNANSK